MKLLVVLMAAVISAPPIIAKGNWLGEQTVQIVQIEGCPAQIVKTQFVDPSHRSGAGNAFIAPQPEKDVTANVSARFRNAGKAPVTAISFLWIAFDAFGKEMGRKDLAFSFPKGIKPGDTKWTNVHVPLFASGPDLYKVSVSRVASDGEPTWEAPVSSIPEAAPASPKK